MALDPLVVNRDDIVQRTWRLPLAGLVAFRHLQFSQIRGCQPYSIVRKIPYLIAISSQLVGVVAEKACNLGLHSVRQQRSRAIAQISVNGSLRVPGWASLIPYSSQVGWASPATLAPPQGLS
jgi:hypothetical protein